MDVRDILKSLIEGRLSIEEAERLIKLLAIEEVGREVMFDLGRELRRDVPEIVLAEGKDVGTISEIVRKVVPLTGRVIISRVPKEYVDTLKQLHGGEFEVQNYDKARIVVVRRPGYRGVRHRCRVAVVTAGTSDIPVAEEARVILEELGCDVITIYDVGVAGIQRVVKAAKQLKEFNSDLAIVIAGREGALPSVLASLIDIPIIAVPTSSGYGFGGNGVTALMSMLQSCSLGIAVVNIDSGVGAAVFASMICRRISMLRGGGAA